jgi:ABC-2 type transport system ATP-binding protein
VESAVQVRGLVREFLRRNDSPRIALTGIDLDVAAGSVHGLLGPNGAGKTTLCKILSTVLLPTAGAASVSGYDVVRDSRSVRRQIGIVFGGERGLYTRLTARQNLRYWAALYRLRNAEGARRTEQLLERFGLADRADERVESFSRGMKQRLHLARGLIGDPRVIILDEPTIGMDPVAAHDFRSLVSDLRSEGRSILITTHDMAEAEAVCDEVTLIDGGSILASADPKTIGTWISAFESVEATGVPERLLTRIREMQGVVGVTVVDDRASIETGASGVAGEVLKVLVDAGVTSARLATPSLEQVYLHVIGNRGMSAR